MPAGIYPRKSPEERFWLYVSKPEHTDCWIWTGMTDRNGYGRLTIKCKKELAHRVSLEIHLKRSLKEGMNVLHSCDNPLCVNPLHLREGTQKENMAEAALRNRVHKGEELAWSKLTEANVIEIRKRLDEKTISQIEIAKEYGVAPSLIHAIYHRKIWKHI